jgi:hypothetical protein
LHFQIQKIAGREFDHSRMEAVGRSGNPAQTRLQPLWAICQARSDWRIMRVQASNPSRLFFCLGLAGHGAFVLLIALLHFIRPDHNPISQALSEYANGPYGMLLSAALFALALGSNTIVLLLLQVSPRSRNSQIGLGLLMIWGIGVFLAGAFPLDPTDAERTLSGTIHILASLTAFVAVIVGINILSMSGAIRVPSAAYPRIAKGLGHASATLFVILFALIPAGLGGLGQRVLVALVLFWFTLTAMHVASVSDGSE